MTRFVPVPERPDSAYESVDADRVLAVRAITVPQGATCDVGAFDVTLSFDEGIDRVYRFRAPGIGMRFITAVERGAELVQRSTEPVGGNGTQTVGVAGV